MKNNKIVLVLPVLFLLTSCGNQTSIRRDDRGDSSATNSVSIINDDDIFDSIVSGITSDELQEIIDASKKALSGIQSVTTNYASSSYKYEEGFINQSIDESHALISKTLRYNNSVLYTNNSASYYSDYEEFEFVNDNDEKLLSSFIYLNFNDDNGHFIEKRSVYQKDGETITTVKLDEQIPYSVTNYDEAFLLLSEDKVLDIKGNTDKAEVIGQLNNGSTIARFIIDEETKTDEEGLTTYQIKKVDYIYKNSNLVNINTYILNYIKDDESVLHINKAITISNEYRYIENGTYDKSQMPELTNLENRK